MAGNRGRLLRCGCLFNCDNETVEIVRAIMANATDEKCGAVDPTADSAGEIGSNAWLKLSFLQSLSQLSRIELNLLSQLLQKPVSEAVLGLEKQIMHLPELVVRSREIPCSGGPTRLRVHFGQRGNVEDGL